MPWGLVWCVAFVALAELVLRLLPVDVMMAMEQHQYAADETLDYVAVDLATSLLPAPDVLTFGTSRGREAIQSPMLTAAVRPRTDRDLEIRNDSTAGGRVDVWIALLDRLISEDKLPEVLIVTLDASDFRDLEPVAHRFRLLDLSTLPDEIARHGWPSERDLTPVIGNSIPLYLVRARATARYKLVHRGDDDGADARRHNAAFGGESGWARLYTQDEVPAEMQQDSNLISRAIKGYRINEAQLGLVRELVERATAHGVRVVLAELPVSPPVRERGKVRRARERLREEMRALGASPCVWSWTLDEQVDPLFGIAEFIDPTHLNRRGAGVYVEQIAPVVADALTSSRCPR